MPIIKPNLLASIKYHARPKAIVRQIRNRLKPSATKQAERIIKTNPNVEHAMIKYPKEKMEDVSRNNLENRTSTDLIKINKYIINKISAKEKYKLYLSSDQEIKEYLEKEYKRIRIMHTHKNDLLPSDEDILNLFYRYKENKNYATTIFVHNELGKIKGKTQFTWDIKKMPDELTRAFTSAYKKILQYPETEKVINEMLHELISKYDSLTLFDKLKTMTIDEIKNMHLSKENILQLKLETYKTLGLIIHFIPAKGYVFDKERMEFIKK